MPQTKMYFRCRYSLSNSAIMPEVDEQIRFVVPGDDEAIIEVVRTLKDDGKVNLLTFGVTSSRKVPNSLLSEYSRRAMLPDISESIPAKLDIRDLAIELPDVLNQNRPKPKEKNS